MLRTCRLLRLDNNWLVKSFKILKTRVLLMAIMHVRRAGIRRWWRSVARLPKWYSTEIPTLPIRPWFFTLHLHFSPETTTSGNWVSELVAKFEAFCVGREGVEGRFGSYSRNVVCGLSLLVKVLKGSKSRLLNVAFRCVWFTSFLSKTVLVTG